MGMKKSFLMLMFGLSIAFAQEIETSEENEVKIDTDRFKDPKIKDLLTPNNLASDVSFRCGMFFSPNEVGEKPKAKVLILPKRFKVEAATFDEYEGAKALYNGETCSDLTDGEPQEAMDKYCHILFSGFVERQNMLSKSQVRDPDKYRMGDDFCEYLTKVGVPRNRVPPNQKFPKGIQVGFYYNKCDDKKWYDTELRMTETVCCKLEGDELKYNAC